MYTCQNATLLEISCTGSNVLHFTEIHAKKAKFEYFTENMVLQLSLIFLIPENNCYRHGNKKQQNVIIKAQKQVLLADGCLFIHLR